MMGSGPNAEAAGSVLGTAGVCAAAAVNDVNAANETARRVLTIIPHGFRPAYTKDCKQISTASWVVVQFGDKPLQRSVPVWSV
jgi:hypothetical protein